MSLLTESFSIQSPKIVSENIQGEVVIIDLNSGNYYSLTEVATEIWSWIEKKAHVSEIVDDLSARYSGDQEAIEEAILQFIAKLHEEGLIAPNQDGDGKAAERAVKKEEHSSDAARSPFAIPRLEKYTDMQEFLLVDPIHEVDERGWPHRKN
jgi:hypothetical protein